MQAMQPVLCCKDAGVNSFIFPLQVCHKHERQICGTTTCIPEQEQEPERRKMWMLALFAEEKHKQEHQTHKNYKHICEFLQFVVFLPLYSNGHHGDVVPGRLYLAWPG